MTLSIIKFIFLQGDEFVDDPPCTCKTYHHTGDKHYPHHGKKQIKTEYLEKLLELASHEIHHHDKGDDRNECGEHTLEDTLDKERRTYVSPRRSYELHRMDREPARIYIEPHRIVYQHERYEQKQGNEDAEHRGNPAEIRVKGIDQGTLIHDLIHKRRLRDLVPDHLETIRRDIVGLQRDVDRNRYRRGLEHVKEVVAEHVRHLPLTLFLRNEHRTSDISLAVKDRLIIHRRLIRNVLLHHDGDLHVLLEVIGHTLCVYKKHCRNAHKQKHKANAYHGRKVGIREPATHQSVICCTHSLIPIGVKDSYLSKIITIFVEILSLKITTMGNSVKRVLFVNSEMVPYLPESPIANTGRYLPQGIQERKKEIRSFMPRYGCINERKNQLHEVIRLSGMNIIINDVDRPLVIKVASISAARMQVYFIDNEDYFHRKSVYHDADGKFFEDNGERAIFFARGVLETVKKLRWAPDVIHCQGWISQILPLYLKKAYIDDPIFSNSKVVLSLYDDTPAEFPEDFKERILFGGVGEDDIKVMTEPTGINLAKLAAEYSDGIIFGAEDIPQEIAGFCKDKGLPCLPYDAESIEDGSYIEVYNSFYDNL